MANSNEKGVILLIAFYNIKALGVRYLESALERDGYRVVTVFYKGFNSIRPEKTTETELHLLCEQITRTQPMLIGLSVMSSMYLDTVNPVIETIKSRFAIPTVCGGTYASMFPERFLDKGVDFVIRADGENAICRLAYALFHGTDYRDISSLCYRWEGRNVINEIGNICENIDDYGIPAVNSKNARYINNDTLHEGDPQLSALSYEVIASRGCPFTCSYCCCVNLKRLFPRGTKYVRIRSVKSVMDELIAAKKELKRLVFVHFYDEIFPNLPGWVDEFVAEYKKHINLPFTIWSHPKMVDATVLKKLVSVGLTEVIMGVQSGSPRIRKDIFHRFETQDDIIKATNIIRESGVYWATYDFMLQHPFETIEDLQETYNIVTKFQPPYELQLHGLSFLPGTDIVPMAIEQGYLTQEKMDALMYAPMEEQFNAYWKRENKPENQLWYRLIYCLQFACLRNRVKKYAENPIKHRAQINRCYNIGKKIYQKRYLYKKARIFFKSRLCQLFL